MRAENEKDVVAAVREALVAKSPLEIVARGTRREFGRPPQGEPLDLSAVGGIVSYEPEELVVSVRPGTPLPELNSVLAAKGQRLGFEPSERGTIGGAVSVDAAGPGRVFFGSARDHLLGIRAVNGLGECFKAGGRVVKNVTGFDIPKLVCGAFGTLCVLTELTFRVFPKPQSIVVCASGIETEGGLALLRKVWSSPLGATGLVYLPGDVEIPKVEIMGGTCLFRLEGAPAPLEEKVESLRALLSGNPAKIVENGEDLFRAVASGDAIASAENLWRVHVPPAQAAALLKAVVHDRWLADWAGGLLWVGKNEPAGDAISAAAEELGGHAVLVRAGSVARARGVFPREEPQRAALTRAIKSAFDPAAILNPGRMYEGV